MLELVLATRNRDKIRELVHALQGLPVRVKSVTEFPGWVEVEETGETLAENALLKARAGVRLTGCICLADDTGLEVDALSGNPGVRSSRYAGEEVTYEQNVTKLLDDLIEVPEAQRTAHFRCVIALTDPSGRETCVEGSVSGLITMSRRGGGGFGYDPVFLVPVLGKTFAEIPVEEKSRLSHRGKAMLEARRIIEEWYGSDSGR